jgi:hypothetical protein
VVWSEIQGENLIFFSFGISYFLSYFFRALEDIYCIICLGSRPNHYYNIHFYGTAYLVKYLLRFFQFYFTENVEFFFDDFQARLSILDINCIFSPTDYLKQICSQAYSL